MFEQAFRKALLIHTSDPAFIDARWGELAEAYTHPSRRYHTLAHLDQIHQELAPVTAAIDDWTILVFAIAYHDAIYNILQSDNEEKSAALAEKKLAEIAVPAERIKRCVNHILATKSHKPSADSDTAFFTDADLSILGQPVPIYQAYSEAIRKEYRYYPDMLYNPGRKKVLKHFLDKERIYQTEHFYLRYETNARKNLQEEWTKLSA